ncbi:MAG: hypothetical protein UT63_C0015G0008 [Candidatus Gottesmanbacteria bacterium GW2011_GWC2_39_8]|uniref:Uncharacterized protein n=1 Tax=Candidatus Gottesmanbacteria bacterium GW2011_GWC2_39_8 TaxID=1618450 RepID=A0A0G0T6Q4_9BACT|nr:MAG: hypothetical protein UT63_C0015G0008 [Candidatus Gottesmanbacteria bacterium GW2011_GWC2_39_8]
MDHTLRHFEESVFIAVSPSDVFKFADNHANFSSHMNKSSWMMMGSKMNTKIDEGKGQKIGSHIQMDAKFFGISLFLDEVIDKYEPPFLKSWHTVGNINLLVICHYRLGFVINPVDGFSEMKVYIDYELPKSLIGKILGNLFAGIYARWCVKQMLYGTMEHFRKQ